MVEENRLMHLLMIPWTGLGLYNGYRGNRWMKNRIKIFEQFVLPSLLNQTDKDFVIWCAWRYEELSNSIVKEFKERLSKITELRFVHTHSGCPFWDDKYPDDIAYERLIHAIHGSIPEILNFISDADTILCSVQPSDDCYCSDMVQETKQFFRENPSYDVFGYRQGYVMDYIHERLAEWNPVTTPPFYTIKFTKEVFINPLKHMQFAGRHKSHEYVKDYLKSYYTEKRGFIVGTHQDNISTIFNHPYTGYESLGSNITLILKNFGLDKVQKLVIPFSFTKWLFRRFPHRVQRKLRYIFGERLFARWYNFMRS